MIWFTHVRRQRPARHHAARRGTTELACCMLLVGLGLLAFANGGHHPIATATNHLTTVTAPAPPGSPALTLQGDAKGAQDYQPIPDSALPACGNTISIPFGPSICVDPRYWIVHGFVGLINWVVNWIISLFVGFIQGMIAHDILFDTPTAVTTQNQAISALYDDMRAVADAAMAFIVLMTGFNILFGTHIGMRATEAKEALPRILLGALGANVALWVIGQAVDGTNDFMHAVAGAPFQFFVPSLSNLPPGVNVLFIVFFGAVGIIVYLLFFILLIFQIFTRLALLDFLIIISPLAITCWILPQTRRAADWWLGLLCSTLILQPLQLLMVAMGMTLVSNINTNEGFWGLATILLQIGLLIATFYLAIRLPALLNYGLFRSVGSVGNPIGMAIDAATTVAGLALAGFAGGVGAAAAGGGVSVTAAGAGGPGAAPAVGGGGAPPMLLSPGGGGDQGGSVGGLPPPGAGGEEYYQPGYTSDAGNGPYGGSRYDSSPDGASAGSYGADAGEGWQPPTSSAGGPDPRPGAGRIVEGSGFPIPDGGAL